jgi:phosphohistidine phosphatase
MLFLVHHAEAVDGTIDPQRPLTDGGRAHAEAIAARAAARGARPAVIWHSGKLRARQTAEHFWRACNPMAELSAVRGLQPNDPAHWIKDIVEGDPRDIMLVGHMPHLGRLLELLMRDPNAGSFPPHGCVAVESREGVWREVWSES